MFKGGPGAWTERMRELGGWREDLAEVSGLTVRDDLCCVDQRGFAGPGYDAAYAVVLPKAGGFLRRADGVEDFVDAASVLLTRPGTEIFHAHPVGPGDRGTSILLSEKVVAGRFDDGRLLGGQRLFATGPLHLRHRELLAACGRGADDMELAERIHALLDELPLEPAERSEGHRPATAVAHRRMVNAACEALTAGPQEMDLDTLAQYVATSPHHLSRVFRRLTGRTITAYRNELRVQAVLQDVHDGAACLRTLAATYGFADQGHLTRVVRRHIGQPPSTLRAMLGN